MPKTKKQESSSDSDSGPDDVSSKILFLIKVDF